MHEITVEKMRVVDGCVVVDLSITKEFKKWFVDNQSLKKWSHKRFQKVFLEAFSGQEIFDFKQGKVKVVVSVV